MILLLLLLMQPAPVAGPNHRLVWDQYAYNLDTVKKLSFTYFLDDSIAGTSLEGVVCTGNAPNFTCSAPIPNMSNGVHTIKLSATNTIGNSGQSTEFRFRYSRNATE